MSDTPPLASHLDMSVIPPFARHLDMSDIPPLANHLDWSDIPPLANQQARHTKLISISAASLIRKFRIFSLPPPALLTEIEDGTVFPMSQCLVIRSETPGRQETVKDKTPRLLTAIEDGTVFPPCLVIRSETPGPSARGRRVPAVVVCVIHTGVREEVTGVVEVHVRFAAVPALALAP